MKQDKTIIEILEEEPTCSTLLSIVKATGFGMKLALEGPITFFAPENEAFEKMATSEFSRLINESKDKLSRILDYHVVPGHFTLNQFQHGLRIQTLNGNDIIIYNKDGIIKINEGKILSSDINASNGLVHTLDSLL